MTDEKYWIAINGSSCALASMPMCNPMTTPTAWQLIGFPTLEEAKRAQRICLKAPMDEIKKFFATLRPDVKSGRVRVIQHEHPQPPQEPLLWTESTDVHAVIQQNFIKTTAD
jgi:hypothetical protein